MNCIIQQLCYIRVGNQYKKLCDIVEHGFYIVHCHGMLHDVNFISL